ncbi:unnamed protein product [Lymnaea stagnalis]|uniref:Methyltransferase domain-containing protein n=1 Tax=Lymnaea stagnalis TaxID=6523 RepID=A0AAV2HMN8_LYMST
MATFVISNTNTAELIRDRVNKLSIVLHEYRWVIDSYVSDFYTKNHWDQLPKSLQEYFDKVDPPELTWMLVMKDAQTSFSVAPLSLLSLHICIQSLVLRREGVKIDSPETQRNISSALLETPHISEESPINAGKHEEGFQSTNSTSPLLENESIQSPNYKNGQCMDMKHIFRKHVKPKKQHEINQLGQAINLLSRTCECKHVVDVGAGLGHLSRLLTFQHGLQVTTVEAADGHASKAEAYDRELHKDIYKVSIRKKSDPLLSSEFLCQNIVESFTNLNPYQTISRNHHKSHVSELDTLQKLCCEHASHSSVIGSMEDKLANIKKQDEKNVPAPVSEICEVTDYQCCFHKTHEDNLEQTSLPHHVKCKVQPDIAPSQFLDIVRARGGETRGGDTRGGEDNCKFVLAGLHACGDLTPTLLRVFVDCPAAMGLASVACCYMKISSSTTGSTQLNNFPMSKFVRDIPHHHLTYVSRELACHFADAYYPRLKANSLHLKIHSYRAALQYLLKAINPEFKSGDVRLVSKRGSRGTFTDYALENLKKVGLISETVSKELMGDCELLCQNWKRVVAYYTLRLSLAPVVESFILLDRALFLQEKGVNSVLVPIFDSKISPRNFALLAAK